MSSVLWTLYRSSDRRRGGERTIANGFAAIFAAGTWHSLSWNQENMVPCHHCCLLDNNFTALSIWLAVGLPPPTVKANRMMGMKAGSRDCLHIIFLLVHQFGCLLKKLSSTKEKKLFLLQLLFLSSNFICYDFAFKNNKKVIPQSNQERISYLTSWLTGSRREGIL